MQSINNKLDNDVLDIKFDLLKLCSIESIRIGGDLSSVELTTILW